MFAEEHTNKRVAPLLYGARKWAIYAAYVGGNRSTQALAYVRANDVEQAKKKAREVFPWEDMCLLECN